MLSAAKSRATPDAPTVFVVKINCKVKKNLHTSLFVGNILVIVLGILFGLALLRQELFLFIFG